MQGLSAWGVRPCTPPVRSAALSLVASSPLGAKGWEPSPLQVPLGWSASNPPVDAMCRRSASAAVASLSRSAPARTGSRLLSSLTAALHGLMTPIRTLAAGRTVHMQSHPGGTARLQGVRWPGQLQQQQQQQQNVAPCCMRHVRVLGRKMPDKTRDTINDIKPAAAEPLSGECQQWHARLTAPPCAHSLLLRKKVMAFICCLTLLPFSEAG